MSLLPEEQVVEQAPLSLLPTPTEAPPPRVPKNVDEVAAEIATALDQEGSFRDRVAAHSNAITAGGKSALLAEVMLQEQEDQVAGAKAQVGAYIAARDAARAAAAAKEADRIANTPTTTNEVEQERTTIERSLENVGADYARRHGAALDKERQAASGDVVLRNIVAQEMQQMGDIPVWDMVSQFFGQVFLPRGYDIMGNRLINKVTGGTNIINSYQSAVEFRNMALTMPPEKVREVVKWFIQQPSGFFGENLAAKAAFLQRLTDLTASEAQAAIALDAWQGADMAVLVKGLATMARQGAPLSAIERTGGQKPAGELAATDLVNKTKLTGLNDSELVSKVLAAGHNPWEALDPAVVEGIGAKAFEKMKTDWDTMLSKVKETLSSTTATPEEIEKAGNMIRQSYMSNPNPHLHTALFGELSDKGQDVVTVWQGKGGERFLSKEAADAWAAERGMLNYEVVPKETAISRADELAGTKAQQRGILGEVFEDLPPSDVPKELAVGDDALVGLAKTRNEAGTRMVLTQLLGPAETADPFFLPELRKMFEMAVREGKSSISLESVLHSYKQSSDEGYRIIAEALFNSKVGGAMDDVRVYLSNVPNDPRAGFYHPGRDKVYLNVASFKNAEETLLHEAIHAHNTQVITLATRNPQAAAKKLSKDQIAAVAELRTLQQRLEKWRRSTFAREAKAGAYEYISEKMVVMDAMKSVTELPDELLAYGLTNPHVSPILQKVKLSQLGYSADERTVTSMLWDLVKRVFGFRADDTAFAKLNELFERLVNSIGENERNIIVDMVKAGELAPQKAAAMLSAKSAKPHIKPKLNEWAVVEKQRVPLPYGAIGEFGAKDIESMAWVAVDPKHGASELGIERRLVGVHAEAKVQKALVDYISPYYKGISKDGKGRIAALLEKGDSFSDDGKSFGREFTFMEARAQGLTDKEAEAYLATRSLRMAMYHIRNGELVKHLRSQGYKEVELASIGYKLPGRELSVESSRGYAGREVFDTATNTVVKLSTKELEEAYSSGKRLITVSHPVSINGEGRTVFLADDTAVKVRDIHTALHYRPGEFSRVYTDEYFVKVTKKQKVDGEWKEFEETIRTAPSQREADLFVKNMSAAMKLGDTASDAELEKLVGEYMTVGEFRGALKNGEFDNMVNMYSHYNRNRDEYLNGSVSEAISNGRLFTSKRSSRVFSTDNTRQNTLGVFESLQAEMTNISRVYNINEWRETMVRRWMNTFGDMLPGRTGDDVADFYAAANAKFTQGTQEALFAERSHKYIMRQIGMRTDEEQFYTQFTRRLTEKMFTGNELVESIGAKIRQSSPLGFIRNINFNLTLGMFNPAQLIVQSNGAATAMLLSPLHGAGAAKTFPILRMALMSDNPKVWSALAKVEKFTNLGLSDEKEFVELIKAVRKTGIIDNIRSTSLWNREEGKHNIFGGYPSKVVGSHAFFFNRGEEFSRLVAFDVARREWRAANPGVAWNTDEALKNILVRADDLTQNMTRANLASFQEGAASIPLQFAQYNIKLAANIMTAFLGKGEGRGFTKREAAQLLAGHVLLYGAAGNGLSMLYDELIPQETRDSMSVATKTLLAQGLLAAIVAEVGEYFTGERTQVAIGSRLGAFNYYGQLAESIFTNDKSVVEALMGPTAGTGRRLGVIGDVAYLWYKNPNLGSKEVLEGFSRMTSEQVATLRNASKAYLFHMHGNKFLDKRGQPMAQLSTPEILAQAIGIQPTAAVDVYNLLDSKKKHTEAIIGVAEMMYQVQKDIMVARAKGDHAYADKQHKLLQALYPENTGDAMEVMRHIREKLYPYDTAFQKLLGQYLMRGQTYETPMLVTKEPK